MTTHFITVYGKTFYFWSDFVTRSTYAAPTDNSQAPKAIKTGGYIHNETTVKKAIILVFGLDKPTTKKVLTDEQKAKKAARTKARREARKAAQA